MAGEIPDVTVLTLSRQRVGLLMRAMDSVVRQDYAGAVEHAVLVDDCAETVRAVRARMRACGRDTPIRSISVWPEPRRAGTDDHVVFGGAYPRLARLLDLGARRARSRWIAWLDDDNEFEPEHLRTLVERAEETGAPAVHSGRQVLWADGSPYLDPVFPWAPDRVSGAQIHEMLCSRGVWVRGTNILLDRAGPLGYGRMINSTRAGVNDPVMLVDTSVWLLSRQVLLKCPVPEEFTQADHLDDTCPDDKFLAALLKRRTRIVSTGSATLRYYLGGMSSRSADPTGPSQGTSEEST